MIYHENNITTIQKRLSYYYYLGIGLSGSSETGRAESRGGSRTLTGARQIRAVIEGSLPPIGKADPSPSGSGLAAREGDSTSARYHVGGGSGLLG